MRIFASGRKVHVKSPDESRKSFYFFLGVNAGLMIFVWNEGTCEVDESRKRCFVVFSAEEMFHFYISQLLFMLIIRPKTRDHSLTPF